MTAMPGADFASLLDEAMVDEDEEGKASLSGSVDYLSVVEELHSGRIHFSAEAARREYLATEGLEAEAVRATPTIQAPPLEPSLPSVDPSDIARELGLGSRSAKRNLDHLRREFAFKNHPDRVGDEMRGRAIVRMQIANMLIDEAKRARSKSVAG